MMLDTYPIPASFVSSSIRLQNFVSVDFLIPIVICQIHL